MNTTHRASPGANQVTPKQQKPCLRPRPAATCRTTALLEHTIMSGYSLRSGRWRTNHHPQVMPHSAGLIQSCIGPVHAEGGLRETTETSPKPSTPPRLAAWRTGRKQSFSQASPGGSPMGEPPISDMSMRWGPGLIQPHPPPKRQKPLHASRQHGGLDESRAPPRNPPSEALR